MKRIFLLLACALCVAAANAQRTPLTESNYPAAERYTGAKVRQMVYSTAVSPQWFELSNRFWYSYTTAEGTRWWLVDPDRGSRRPLFDNERMAAELTRILKDPYDAQHLPISGVRLTADEKAFRFIVPSKVEEEEIVNRVTGEKKKEKKRYVFEYDLASGKLTHLEDYKPKELPNWGNVSPDGQSVVFVKNYDLWMMDRENYEKAMVNEKDTTIVETRLTSDCNRLFGFGSSSTNSGDDMQKEAEKRGRARIVWSPDSRNFAAVITDQRAVKDLWVINNTARPRPTLSTYRYQMPGEKGAPQYHLYVYNMEKRQLREVGTQAFKDQVLGIEADKPVRERHDDYTISSSVWMGGNDEFFITRLSRDMKRMDLCKVDLETLMATPVVEERFNTYIEEGRQAYLTNGVGSDLVMWSEEDGWAHLYLHGYDGKRKGQITSGAWHVDRVVEIDPAARVIYFTANGREKDTNPYYNFLYRVNFDGSGLRLLTPGDYSHEVSMHERRRYVVENITRVDDTPRSVLRDVSGREVMQLEKADLSRLFETGYKFPTRFKVKAADGITDLYGTLYVPFDLDSTKLYPIIEYVYPGPQTEGVEHMFHAPGLRLDRLAQLGFVVVTVGNRGGDPRRSRWYHNFGYGNMRDYGLPDKKAAAIQLADRYPFMDLSRVGITGHSGGGFMSTAAILMYPDFFKVAVSAAGNHDNSIYNRGWSEKHHGVEEKVDEKTGDTTFVYKVANNQQLAGNLKGHLLLVTGDVDNNVHPANTIVVAEALIRAGKRFDMLVLPGQAHSFNAMNEYFFWRMADYFCEHLLGDSEIDSVNIPQLRE